MTVAPGPGLHPGLCSVTLRALRPVEVLAVAADAGLTCVEWGGDVHVPPDRPAVADQVRAATDRAGLRVASYGSYLRAGSGDTAGMRQVVATAARLGAPRIRIWAGTVPSAAAAPAERAAVADDARRLADLAAGHGIGVAFEFHGGTLTDDPDSTLRLLDAVHHPGVGTYWQPPNDTPDAAVLAGLAAVLDRVAAAHVFSWWPGTERLQLAARADLWRAALAALRGTGRAMDTLLEFVPGDDPALVAAEAATLRALAG